MTDKQLDKLIRRKANVAAVNQDLATQLGPLLEARYGVEPGAVDCDAVIDAIDYGAVRGCSLAYVDKHMTICGHPPLVANKKLSNAVSDVRPPDGSSNGVAL